MFVLVVAKFKLHFYHVYQLWPISFLISVTKTLVATVLCVIKRKVKIR